MEESVLPLVSKCGYGWLLMWVNSGVLIGELVQR